MADKSDQEGLSSELSHQLSKKVSKTKMSPANPNPFVLPPVLEVLFKNCDFETLKTARRVSKLWHHVSNSTFNHNSLINFYSMYPETYIQVVQSIDNGCKPQPVNVALTLSPLYGEPVYYNKNLTVCPFHACEEFIFPFGSSIESLKFYAWDSVSQRLNCALFREILLTPQKLKLLEISLLPSDVVLHPLFPKPWMCQPPLFFLRSLVMYGNLECSFLFLLNFFSAMPNINSITVNCCSIQFLDMFTSALYKVAVKKLEHLKLNFVTTFDESHILNIKKANLRLKTLHTAPRSQITHFDPYTRLLTQLAPTVEDAKITSCSRPSEFEQFIQIPLLPKLKILRLQSWQGGAVPGYWNLSFINQIPNLESLILERRGLFVPSISPAEGRCFIEESDVRPHKNLKNLVLPTIPPFFPHVSTLASLLQKFKSLTKLTMSANDACLNCIFLNAPHLTELTIAEYSKITDAGITGLTMRAEEKNCNGRVAITVLQDLRRLELDGFGGRITSFSVRYGIMHLRKLEFVLFRGCKISARSAKLLSKVQVTVVGHDFVHTFAPEPLEDVPPAHV